MATITKKEVEHIAKLARLELTGEEIEKMQKDLSGVLDYFNLFKKVKSGKEVPDLLKREKVMRKDEANPQADEVAKKLVKAFPDKKDDYIKVKAIF